MSTREALSRMSLQIMKEDDDRASKILRENSRRAFRRRRWAMVHECAAAHWVSRLVFDEDKPAAEA